MRKLFYLLISIPYLLNSYISDEKETIFQPHSSTEEEILLCSFDLVNKQYDNASKSNAAIINWPRWQIGQTVKVKFLDGNETQHQKVKKYIDEWTKYANLNFVYVPVNEYADIRVGFNAGAPGAWSQLGMESAYGTGNWQNEPSIRFGSLNSAYEKSISRTVLHELGHALGLVHETTNPAATIQWDLPKTYKYFMEGVNGFTKEEVDQFVINKRNSTNYSNYDSLSIMHYYIPASITTNGVGVNEMSELSETDKDFINKCYPFPIVSVLKSGQNLNNLPWKDRLKSPNGRYLFEFIPGFFRVIDLNNNQTIWSVGNESYKRKAFGYFESNGNLTLRGAQTPLSKIKTIWTSKTSEFPGATLHLNDDGNLELIQNGVVRWSSKNVKS